MVALFDQFALFEHQDAIDIADGREAVGDDDRGPVFEQLFQGILNQRLGAHIQIGGRLIQNQNAGITNRGAGKGQQLFLAA